MFNLFKKNNSEGENKVCGYLDDNGNFWKTKFLQNEANYRIHKSSIESQADERIWNIISKYESIHHEPFHKNNYQEFLKFCYYGGDISKIFDILRKKEEKLEEIKKLYNQ